jgi:hypothetical protein
LIQFKTVQAGIQDSTFEQTGRYGELQDLVFNLHIGHEFYNGKNMDENLLVFDLKQDIYKAMKNFQATGSSSITRIGEAQDVNHNNVYHYIQTYKCNLIDEDANPETIEHKATYQIELTNG